MAGRIPESFVEDLLSRTDLVELIDHRVKLKRSGKNYSACCPFHQEKTPSFTVSPQKQFYYCFGCGANGNAISFLMDYERLGFVDAVEELARQAGVEVPREQTADHHRHADHLKPLHAALEAASRFYQQQLRNPKVRERAISYLKKRGLDGLTSKNFQIGFAPAGWDNLLKALEKDHTVETLIQAGLVVRNDAGRIYDRFRDRIMFPIRDSRGRTIAFGGRVLGDDKPKYLNSPETPVFHKGKQLYGLFEARQQRTPITRFLVVEGYMDVVTLAQHQIPYAVATLGTASSTEQLELLFRHVDEVIFCFDGDAAGRTAAERALDNALSCMKDGREIKFLFLPEGEDPDSLIRKSGKALFEHEIQNAQPLSDYFFETCQGDTNPDTLDGKARLAKEAINKIAVLPKSLFRQMLIERLAQITDLPSNHIETATEHAQAQLQHKPAQGALNRNSGSYTNKTTHEYQPAHYSADPYPAYSSTDYDGYSTGPAPKKPVTTASPGSVALVDHAIRLVLHAPREASKVELPQALREFKAPYMELLVELADLIKERPDLSTAGLLGRWHGSENGEHLAQLAAKEFLVEPENREEDLKEAYHRLWIAKIDADFDALIQAGAKDKAKLKELLELKKQIS